MAREIERKFLVRNEDWRAAADAGTPFRQGWLGGEGRASVRVRIEGGSANLNIKSRTLGIVREEFEYPIPLADAEALLALADGPLVEKRRHHVPYGAHVFEVDVFEGENAGLVVAEIELADVDEPFARPDWLGPEVSHDPRYYNVMLAQHPFRRWGD